jgi:hypothetical protein
VKFGGLVGAAGVVAAGAATGAALPAAAAAGGLVGFKTPAGQPLSSEPCRRYLSVQPHCWFDTVVGRVPRAGQVGLSSLVGSWCVRTAGGLAVRGIRLGAGLTERGFQAADFAVDVASSTIKGSGAEMLLGLEGAQVPALSRVALTQVRNASTRYAR